MIKQMMYIFEDQIHELRTKSGLFIFLYTKKMFFNNKTSSNCDYIVVSMQVVPNESIPSQAFCGLIMPLFKSSCPEEFCKKGLITATLLKRDSGTGVFL